MGYNSELNYQIPSCVVDNHDGHLIRSLLKKNSTENDAVDERLKNLEHKFGITNSSTYSSDVYARLKILEDKILKIEEFYPQIAVHTMLYSDKDSSIKSGRVTRVPGFYKDIRSIKKKKFKNEAPLGIELEVKSFF